MVVLLLVAGLHSRLDLKSVLGFSLSLIHLPSVLSLQIVIDSMPDDGIADSVLPWSRFDTQKSYCELNKAKFKQITILE